MKRKISIILFLALSSTVFGQEAPSVKKPYTDNPAKEVTPEKENQESRLSFIGITGIATVSGSNSSLLGFYGGLNAAYALKPKITLGVGGGAALSSSLSGVFSELSVNFNYALIGRFIRNQNSVSIGATEITRENENTAKVLSLGVSARQLLLTGSSSTTSFSGLGFSGVYRFPTQTRFFYSLGGEFAFLQGGSSTLSVLKMFISLGFHP